MTPLRFASALRGRVRGGPSERKGFFEGVVSGRISGWTYDPAAPSRRLHVFLLSPDGETVSLVADRYRADAQLASGGDGFCGFSMPASPLSSRSIRCVWTDTGTDLPGSPWRVSAPSALAFARGSVVGMVRVTGSGTRQLTGYAIDRAAPHRRLWIRVDSAASQGGAVRATRYEPAAPQELSDGFHGFSVVTPAPRRAGRLTIRDAETGETLARLGSGWLHDG